MTHGTETRLRSSVLGIRLTPEERAIVDEAAERAGLATGSYAREVLLGAPAPRQVRRPPIERGELARLLGELGHVGANLNQLAHRANSGMPIVQRDLYAVLKSLVMVRDAVLIALGRTP